MSHTPQTLVERYGAPQRGRRRLLIGATAVVAAVFLGWLVWAAWFHATPAATSDLLSYSVSDEHTAQALVDVTLHGDPEEQGVRCLVRALAEDHTPVGEKSFVPTPGHNTIEVRTERRATSVTLVGCTAEGQPRPR